MIKKGKERLAGHYNAAYTKRRAKSTKISAEAVYYPSWRKVISWLRPVERILDLGCGSGGFAEMAIKAGVRYRLGVDFSKVAIKWAQERNLEYRDRFRVYDILRPEVMQLVAFDTLVILETLEHINRDLPVLATVPGGKRVILSVPSFGGSSHVRYFNRLEDVVDRYSKMLSVTRAEAVVIGTNEQTLWLVYGFRKD